MEQPLYLSVDLFVCHLADKFDEEPGQGPPGVTSVARSVSGRSFSPSAVLLVAAMGSLGAAPSAWRAQAANWTEEQDPFCLSQFVSTRKKLCHNAWEEEEDSKIATRTL